MKVVQSLKVSVVLWMVSLLILEPVVLLQAQRGGGTLFSDDLFDNNSMGSGITNLRMMGQSPDKREVTFIMDYVYDGSRGPTALVIPVIVAQNRPEVKGWFGADPRSIGKGRGTVTLVVRFFNDEVGVPAVVESDTVQIWILNQTGFTLIGATPFGQKISWGMPGQQSKLPLAGQGGGSANHKQELAQAEDLARSSARQAEADSVRAREEALKKEAEEKKAREEAMKLAAKQEVLKREEARMAEERRVAEEAERKAQEELAHLKEQAQSLVNREGNTKKVSEVELETDLRSAIQAESSARKREATRVSEEASRINIQVSQDQERQLADAEAKARLLEAERAEAQRRADELATKREREQIKAEQLKIAQQSIREGAVTTGGSLSISVDTSLQTAVKDLEIVNRNLDRTQMLVGVHFQFMDKSRFPNPMMGVNVLKSDYPQATHFFESTPEEIGTTSRRPQMKVFPVKYNPPRGASQQFSTLATDKIVVYLKDVKDQQSTNLKASDVPITWQSQNPAGSGAMAATTSADSVELIHFEQQNFFSAFATIRYRLSQPSGFIQLRIYDAANPKTAEWFESRPIGVVSGNNMEVLEIRVRPDAPIPGTLFSADTIEVVMVDGRNGSRKLAEIKRTDRKQWSRPR